MVIIPYFSLFIRHLTRIVSIKVNKPNIGVGSEIADARIDMVESKKTASEAFPLLVSWGALLSHEVTHKHPDSLYGRIIDDVHQVESLSMRERDSLVPLLWIIEKVFSQCLFILFYCL